MQLAAQKQGSPKQASPKHEISLPFIALLYDPFLIMREDREECAHVTRQKQELALHRILKWYQHAV